MDDNDCVSIVLRFWCRRTNLNTHFFFVLFRASSLSLFEYIGWIARLKNRDEKKCTRETEAMHCYYLCEYRRDDQIICNDSGVWHMNVSTFWAKPNSGYQMSQHEPSQRNGQSIDWMWFRAGDGQSKNLICKKKMFRRSVKANGRLISLFYIFVLFRFSIR